MIPHIPYAGLASDVLHIAKRGQYHATQKGDDASFFKIVSGAALCYLGLTMLYKEYRHQFPGGVRLVEAVEKHHKARNQSRAK